MLAITFEADIVSEYLRIPNFEQFKNMHVRVVIEEEEERVDEPELTASAKTIKIAHIQSLIDEGIASGIGTHRMAELKEMAKSRIAASKC